MCATYETVWVVRRSRSKTLGVYRFKVKTQGALPRLSVGLSIPPDSHASVWDVTISSSVCNRFNGAKMYQTAIFSHISSDVNGVNPSHGSGHRNDSSTVTTMSREYTPVIPA